MAVKIRLARHGAKKRPYYRIIVADSRKPRDGKFIEEVGRYNPCVSPSYVLFDEERVNYWLGVGAQPTDTVARLWEAYDGSSNAKDAAPQSAPEPEPVPDPEPEPAPEPEAESAEEAVSESGSESASEQDA